MLLGFKFVPYKRVGMNKTIRDYVPRVAKGGRSESNLWQPCSFASKPLISHCSPLSVFMA